MCPSRVCISVRVSVYAYGSVKTQRPLFFSLLLLLCTAFFHVPMCSLPFSRSLSFLLAVDAALRVVKRRRVGVYPSSTLSSCWCCWPSIPPACTSSSHRFSFLFLFFSCVLLFVCLLLVLNFLAFFDPFFFDILLL